MAIIIFKKRERFTNFITSVFRLKALLKTDLHFENKRAHKSYSGLIRKKSYVTYSGEISRERGKFCPLP